MKVVTIELDALKSRMLDRLIEISKFKSIEELYKVISECEKTLDMLKPYTEDMEI